MKVAYIGLGTMGARMVRNLLKAGHEVVVNDVRREAAEPLIALGARWAESPALAASGAEITFTSLPGPKEVEAVAMGESGVLHGIAEGAIYADLSTSSATPRAADVRRLQRARRPRPRRAGQRRAVRRRDGDAHHHGRRRRGGVPAGAPGPRLDRRQHHLHRRCRGRGRRQAGPQHDRHRLGPDSGRGVHPRRQGRRLAGEAAGGGPGRRVRQAHVALAGPPERGVQGRLRQPALRAGARPQGPRAGDGACARAWRADGDGRRRRAGHGRGDDEGAGRQGFERRLAAPGGAVRRQGPDERSDADACCRSRS